MLINFELLRKRSEHNDGEIHSLEELSLHQENIEKIEFLEHCKQLKILLLQNNVISKIENLTKLKNLNYLNLALNNIKIIENLEGCESLKKLDLTLNFIKLLSSVESLQKNIFLESLYLVGNPCSEYSGYRDYVITVLPKLKQLDGTEINQSERIRGRQNFDFILNKIKKFEEEIQEKSNLKLEKMENLDELSDTEFWKMSSENTPETRAEMARRLEKSEREKEPKPKEKKRPRRLFNDNGKPLNVNEGKIPFKFEEVVEKNLIILDISVPKYLDSSLIESDIHPTYFTAKIKGKIFQIVLPEEIESDSALAQRSKTTGHLVIKMPKVMKGKSEILIMKSEKKGNANKLGKLAAKSENLDWKNIVKIEEKSEENNNDFIDDPSVPPLI